MPSIGLWLRGQRLTLFEQGLGSLLMSLSLSDPGTALRNNEWMNELKLWPCYALSCGQIPPGLHSRWHELCWGPRMGSTCISGSCHSPSGTRKLCLLLTSHFPTSAPLHSSTSLFLSSYPLPACSVLPVFLELSDCCLPSAFISAYLSSNYLLFYNLPFYFTFSFLLLDYPCISFHELL